MILTQELNSTLKDLCNEFTAKAESLKNARALFANLDPEIQLSILQTTSLQKMDAVKSSQLSAYSDPCYLTLCNLYWSKMYSLIISKLDVNAEFKARFYSHYCTQNSTLFTMNNARAILSNLNESALHKSPIDELATQVGIYNTVFNFKFCPSQTRTRIKGANNKLKPNIDSAFHTIRTFEKIASSIGLNINDQDSLLKFSEDQFADAIDYLEQDLRYNRGEYFKVNDHLEVQLHKSNAIIYIKFSDIAAEKLNRIYRT